MKKTIEMKPPFSDRYRPTYQPSSVRKVTSTPSQYAELLDTCATLLDVSRNDIEMKIHAAIKQVLHPAEIQTLLEQTIQFETHPNYAVTMGIITTKLVQNAIDKPINRKTWSSVVCALTIRLSPQHTLNNAKRSTLYARSSYL